MFKSARIKLTAWYMAIALAVSILFSISIYSSVSVAAKKALEFQYSRLQMRQDVRFPQHNPRGPLMVDEQTLKDINKNILNTLIVANIIVLITSGGIGYFLAGKTLKPIEEMISEQKRFMSDAAHELKTPLTSLKTEIEVTLRDKELDFNKTKKTLKSSLEEVNRLSLLTNNILKSSNLDEIENSITFKETDISGILEKSIKNVGAQAKEKNITLKSKFINTNVYGNKEKLIDLFTILMDNAIKYSNKNSKVDIYVEDQKTKTLVRIKDYGIGIDEKDLQKIFSRFYRADFSRKNDKINSFGLGLSIAKKIVDLHRGKITVDSTPNNGSTFTVCLPKNKNILSI